jgi:hypothetical protein
MSQKSSRTYEGFREVPILWRNKRRRAAIYAKIYSTGNERSVQILAMRCTVPIDVGRYDPVLLVPS